MKENILKGIGLLVLYLTFNGLTVLAFQYQETWFSVFLFAPTQIAVMYALYKFFYGK